MASGQSANVRGYTMVKWLTLGLRVALGAAFVYAGVLKIQDPSEFAINIASFQILPNVLISAMALALPPFEIITGGLLIIGVARRPAALGIVLLSAIFLIAIAAALARGLTIDCGCFGTAAPSRGRMWLDLGRDILLLAAGVMVYRFGGYRRDTGTQAAADAA
jgi:putative oxidoreductase